MITHQHHNMKNGLLAALAIAISSEAKAYTSQFVPDPLQHYPSRSSQGTASSRAQVPDSEGAHARMTTRLVSTLFGKRFGWGFGNGHPYTGGLTGDLNTVVALDNTSTLNRVATLIGNQLSSGILGKAQASPSAHDEACATSKSVFIPQKRNVSGAGQPGVCTMAARIACHDLTHNGWWMGFKTAATRNLLVAAAADELILAKSESANTYSLQANANSAGVTTVAVTPATTPVVDIEDTWVVTFECGTVSDGSDSVINVWQNGIACVLTVTNLAALKQQIYNMVVTTPPTLNAAYAEVNLDSTQRAGVSFMAVWAEAD